MITNHNEIVLRLVKKKTLLKSKDLKLLSVPRVVLTRLVRKGLLIRVKRGLYSLPDRLISEHESLIKIASCTSQGVFCLITALHFHHLTTQAPFEIWLAVPNKVHPPKLDYPPIRIVHFSGASLSEGIETYIIDRVPVKIYSIAKTVADCFKYRNKIGLDLAIEALTEAWRKKCVQMDDLWRYAHICRVANVMRPYLESLL